MTKREVKEGTYRVKLKRQITPSLRWRNTSSKALELKVTNIYPVEQDGQVDKGIKIKRISRHGSTCVSHICIAMDDIPTLTRELRKIYKDSNKSLTS